MKLSAPKQGTFVISVLLLIIALIVKFVATPLTPHAFWFAVASQVVLMLGSAIKGF